MENTRIPNSNFSAISFLSVPFLWPNRATFLLFPACWGGTRVRAWWWGHFWRWGVGDRGGEGKKREAETSSCTFTAPLALLNVKTQLLPADLVAATAKLPAFFLLWDLNYSAFPTSFLCYHLCFCHCESKRWRWSPSKACFAIWRCLSNRESLRHLCSWIRFLW